MVDIRKLQEKEDVSPDSPPEKSLSVENGHETSDIRREVKDSVDSKVNEGNTNANRMKTIDEAFDEILDKVKDSPEARQIVLRAAIEQMRQISEQLKRVRDAEQLHELKKMMIQKWKELNDLTKDQPELLEQIQNWGQQFIDQKVIFYDTVNAKKEQLVEKAGEIENTWVDMQSVLGKMSAMGEYVGYINTAIHSRLSSWSYHWGRSIGKVRTGSGMEDLLELLNNSETGLEGDDTPVSLAAKDFRDIFTALIRKINEWAYTSYRKESPTYEGGVGGIIYVRPIDHFPELKSLLDSLQTDYKKIAGDFRDVSKTFHLLKKIRDTHFLPLYNAIPERLAA